MYKILKAEELTTNIYLMNVEAPRVAKSCQPGRLRQRGGNGHDRRAGGRRRDGDDAAFEDRRQFS